MMRQAFWLTCPGLLIQGEDACLRLLLWLWFSPGKQLSTVQSFANFHPPERMRGRESEGQKLGKPWSWGKGNLESNDVKDAQHSGWPSAGWCPGSPQAAGLPARRLPRFYCWAWCHTVSDGPLVSSAGCQLPAPCAAWQLEKLKGP